MVKFLDSIAKALYGKTQQEARAAGICIRCGNPPTPFKDVYDEREYNLSGLCGKCFDAVCAEQDPDDIDR